MASTPTTITPLTATQFAQRMAAVFPKGWCSEAAKMSGGVIFAEMEALGTAPAAIMLALQYALDAMRIQTGENGALDLASLDFFGSSTYALPRNPGESDTSFAARILAAMLPTGATRAAVSAAVEAVTGYAPRIIEPWSPADTGVIDGVGSSLAGAMYLDVDTPVTPARLADPSLRYQAFLESVLPSVSPLGGNPMPCIDDGIYMDAPGSSMFDFEGAIPLGEEIVYAAINRTKVEGTVIWVKFVATPPGPPTGFEWDAPNLYWDQPGLNWG